MVAIIGMSEPWETKAIDIADIRPGLAQKIACPKFTRILIGISTKHVKRG